MGKKTRKTRWRALTLADEFSDSETSSTTTAPGLSEVFKTNKFSSRYTYSSHSTPRRKFHYDGTKSTRSSSTTDENKIPFNEDDYTKISTPRQDVLFKKGYLNKPKNYNTQSSTGASTNSTGNSTGNGTPEYQSTDLEYESQFVFPNGFVDHNGFYYVNSYDYPFMFYNVPTYYPEYSNCRSKKYSSGSLTESTSPNNEEITSQDLSCGEASNSHSDHTDHSLNHVINHNEICSQYYQNGTSPHDSTNEECHVDQTRKIKKRRRRKTTCQSGEQDTNSDEEIIREELTSTLPQRIESKNVEPEKQPNESTLEERKETTEPEKSITESKPEVETSCEGDKEISLENGKEESCLDDQISERENPELLSENESTEILSDSKNLLEEGSLGNSDVSLGQNQIENQTDQLNTTNHSEQSSQDKLTELKNNLENREDLKHSESTNVEILNTVENSFDQEISDNPENINQPNSDQNQDFKDHKYDLKVDAEEFVPRAYRVHDIPLSPVQFVNISGNFVPMPLFPFNGQSFNPAFIPPGFPINFIPPDPKIFPGFVGFPQNGPPPTEHGEVYNENQYNPKIQLSESSCDNLNTANDPIREVEPKDKNKVSSKTIDIATVVSKLEVAAKEQKQKENNALNAPEDNNSNCPSKHPRNHKFRSNLSFKGNYKNRTQNSPQREMKYHSRDLKHKHFISDSNSKQNVESNHAIASLVKQDQHTINHPESSTRQNTERQNIDSQVSSPSTFSSNQDIPIVTSTQSPLRENEEYNRKLPYKKHQSQSITNTVNSSIVSQSSEVKSPSSSQKSLENFKKVWKQSYNNHNKWKQSNTERDSKTKYYDKKTPEHVLKSEVPNRIVSGNIRNTINNSLQVDKNVDKDSPNKSNSVNLPQESSPTLLRSPNQWISVQKRKKRKNKNIEEYDSFLDEEIDDNQNDQFESYDVNLLVDVLPSQNESKNVETNSAISEVENDSIQIQDQQTEEILTIVFETEPSIQEKDALSSPDLIEPKELENNSVHTEDIVNSETSPTEIQSVSEVSKELPEKEDGTESQTIKDKKKKFKKNSQKLPKKKVIIKDIDLSDQHMEIKEPVKKIVTKWEKSSEVVANTAQESLIKYGEDIKTEVTLDTVEAFEKEVSPESVNSIEQDERKKSKKKKKKSPKTNTTISFNSDSMLDPIEETFDFLGKALNGEAEDKTNDEISQELDKIIQKGMLSSIEEKIKSLNIDENDGFFKSVSSKLSRKETTMGYTKIPDFTEILKPTSKPPLVSEEIDLQNITCSKIIHDADPIEPTTEDGLFLESPNIVEILEDDQTAVLPDKTEDVKHEKSKIIKYRMEIEEFEQPNTLYPITKAVREWMVRTRENTPDVELLKSPSRIYEEFGDNVNSDSETEGCEAVDNFSKELSPNSEITLFAAEREQSLEQDLLDFWDDDVKDSEYVDVSNERISDNRIAEDDEEEELPVYDSKYGKNEDFLNIQKRIREQNENGPRTPQNQNGLPQRAAACCNIM